MKKYTKALLLVLCALMLVAASVFGTLAYLTDTAEATNTFTVGNVKITMDEAKVDEYGAAVEGAARVQENTYKLIPGHSYTKDPTVTVVGGSEESYVRMIVTVTFQKDISSQEGTDLASIFTGYDARWVRTGYSVAADGKSIVYEYRYQADANTATVAKSETDTKLPALFTGITVPANLTNDTLAVFAGMEIEIVAHAIQADGFADANAAWAAFPTN